VESSPPARPSRTGPGRDRSGEFAHIVGERCPVNIALHTDHCHPEKVDTFLRPLLAASRRTGCRREGTALPEPHVRRLAAAAGENMRVAKELLAECAELDIILEVEAGVVGGEEDGVSNEGVAREKLYTTPETCLPSPMRSAPAEKGRYLFAATFGTCTASTSRQRRAQADDPARRPGGGPKRSTARPVASCSSSTEARLGAGGDPRDARLWRRQDERRYRHAVRTHACDRRSHVQELRRRPQGDGEVGVKKVYDPRSYMKAAETSMATRVVRGLRGPALDGDDFAQVRIRRLA